MYYHISIDFVNDQDSFEEMLSIAFSYTPNYFSIEDILATQERVSCKFDVTVPKLGKI